MREAGAYIQWQRKAAGLTQEELARHLGVTSRTISSWETGRTSPTLDVMGQMVRLIGLKVDEVIRRFFGPEDDQAGDLWDIPSVLALADTDPKRLKLLQRIAELSDDPVLRARIEGYLDGLEAAE